VAVEGEAEKLRADATKELRGDREDEAMAYRQVSVSGDARRDRDDARKETERSVLIVVRKRVLPIRI